MTLHSLNHIKQVHLGYTVANEKIVTVLEVGDYIHRIEGSQFDLFHQKFHNSIKKTIEKFNGTTVFFEDSSYIVLFKNISDAVFCAIKIHNNLNYITPNFDPSYRRLKIGVCLLPSIQEGSLIEEAIAHATHLCDYVIGDIILSSEIKRLYSNHNENAFLKNEHVRLLKASEEQFLSKLIYFIEKHWDDSTIDVTMFSKFIGYSKSQLNRKLKALTGKSPNKFIKSYRLHQALKLMYNKKGNISEIASRTGFNNSTYFTKCFNETYGLLPSIYLQKHVYFN